MIAKLIEKFNKFIDKGLKGFKQFWFTPVGRVSILIGVFLVASVPLVLMVLGFDNYIIRSTVSGTIYSIDNEVVPGAELIIQGKSVKSDENGYFYLDNLDYGKWEVLIKANGFSEYKEMVTLERFGNSIDFELSPLDFGVVKGALVVQELTLQDLRLYINDQNITIGETGAFESGKLIVGKYKLKFESPYYKDFEEEIEIKSGIHRISPIQLLPTGDIKFSIIDGINGDLLKDVDLTIAEVAKDSIVETEGVYEIKDIEVGTKLKIVVKEDDYEDFEFSWEVVGGLNDLGNLSIIQQEIVFFEEYGNVYAISVNGANKVLLSDGLAGCKYIGDENSFVYLGCSEGIYKSDIESGSYDKVYDSYSLLDRYISGLGILKIDGGKMNLISNFDEIEIFSSPSETIISLVQKPGVGVYFSTEKAVYKINQTSLTIEEVTQGEFFLQDINAENGDLVALNYTSSAKTESKIWVIKSNGEKSSLTVFPDRYRGIGLLSDGRVAAYLDTDGGIALYSQSLNGGDRRQLLASISHNIYIQNKGQWVINSSSDIYLLSPNGNLVKIKEG